MNGWKIHNTQMTPKILNTMCAMADLRACVFAVNAARLEVTVVPIFSPITSAIPW